MAKNHLFDLSEKVGVALKKHQAKITCAESCTGGGIAYWLTEVPGSSEWFDRAYVTYNDKAKMEMLNISSQLLEKHGAVSEKIAIEMAQQALNLSQAQVSIAVTGIAGPNGGTPAIPVGTIWLAFAGNGFTPFAKHYLLTGNRTQIREQAVEEAFSELLKIL